MLDIFSGSAVGALEPFLAGASGFVFKMLAQQQANLAKERLWRMDAHKARNESAEAAAKRGGIDGAVVRRFIAFLCFASVFGCIVYVAINQGVTSHVYLTEVKSQLFGLFSTGGKLKTIETQGFTLTPEMWRILFDILFFYFGAGVAKAK